MEAEIILVMKVKLPSDSAYHSSPSRTAPPETGFFESYPRRAVTANLASGSMKVKNWSPHTARRKLQPPPRHRHSRAIAEIAP